VLADAIPRVLAELPQARFVFVGDDRPDGQGRTWRSRLAEQLGAQEAMERVHFAGAVTQPELFAWYGRADIAVVPSLIYESFSYTCAQAAAAGLPVVASRIGGIPDTIPHEIAGVITEPGNAQELAVALTRLGRDTDLRDRMGSAGQEKAIREFNAPTVAARVL